MSTKKNDAIKVLESIVGPLTFGRALQAHRLCEEVSLKDFAKALGISPAALCDLEKGRRIPSIARASSIAKKLDKHIGHWVQLAIQDQINEQGLKFKVSIA